MKDFLDYLIRQIADDAESVVVNEMTSPDGSVLLNVTVAQSDMGKIIGKNGKVIKSLRDLTRVLAIKHNQRVTISLVED